MLKIDILGERDLQNTCEKLISALLPHEGYNPKFFSTVLQAIFRYVKLDEFEMEYYLLLKALSELERLFLSFEDYVPRLERETFSSLVETSVMDAVVRPEIGMKEWLQYEGMDSNLDNEAVREDACQKLFVRCMDLYDRCFELGIASEDALNYEPEYAMAFKQSACTQALNIMAEILRDSARIGRRTYSGVDDYLRYQSLISTEIAARVKNAEGDKSIDLSNIENAKRMLAQLKFELEPISKWGIPPLDQGTPILKHRLVVVCANENVGKTHFLIDKAVNVLLDGGNVVYMCGETTKAKVFCKIIINYVWKKYGVIIRECDVIAPEESTTDLCRIINMSIIELTESQALRLVETFNYATMEKEMLELYNESPYDLLTIDHSCALSGTVGDGSLYSKVGALASATLSFKKAYPVCILVASHTSTIGKEALARGKEIDNSVTKGNNDLSANADEVFVLDTNTSLKKQSAIKLINSKRRDAHVLIEPLYLKTNFAVSAYIYDENNLTSDTGLTLEQQEALDSFSQDLEDEDNPY